MTWFDLELTADKKVSLRARLVAGDDGNEKGEGRL
jgi:hypothetical protein